MVAILLFVIVAGVAIYEGVRRIKAPTPISDPAINYAVLSLAIGFEDVACGWLSRDSKRPDSAASLKKFA